MTKRNSSELEFTGERIVPGKAANFFFQEHVCRYKLMKKYIRGKVVLDAGCGEGYGTYYLAHYARKVVGIDISEEAIERAKEKYVGNNLQYVTTDCCHLEFPDEFFDVICSFEVMEHIPYVEGYLAEIKRTLKSDGLFVVSTPNKDNYPLTELNEFHYKEYSLYELRKILDEHFPKVEYLGQKCVSRFKKYYNYGIAKMILKFNMMKSIQNIFGRFPIKGKSMIINLNDLKTDAFSFTKRNLSDADYFIAFANKKERGPAGG